MIKPLTPMQARVVAYVAKGWSYQAIAMELQLSARTVEHYVQHIDDKIEGTEVEYGIPPYRRVQRWALTTNAPEVLP